MSAFVFQDGGCSVLCPDLATARVPIAVRTAIGTCVDHVKSISEGMSRASWVGYYNNPVTPPGKGVHKVQPLACEWPSKPVTMQQRMPRPFLWDVMMAVECLVLFSIPWLLFYGLTAQLHTSIDEMSMHMRHDYHEIEHLVYLFKEIPLRVQRSTNQW